MMLIIQMDPQSTSLDVARVCEHQEKQGYQARVVTHSNCCQIISGAGVNIGEIEKLPSVKKVIKSDCSYPLASRDAFGASMPVRLSDNILVGGGEIAIIAGPCAIESREQLIETAQGVKASGASMLRGGAFKPRSNPYSFQGLGSEGIDLLVEAREKTGLPIVTEVMSPQDVEWLEPQIDVFQVGTRNMQNFALLKALGRARKPVLLKRGMASTVDEWLQAAEYILAGGNTRVVLCERGIRSFDKSTRNTLDLSIVPLVKSLTHLPIIVDPSHATGKRELILPMSLAALAAGADGLIIEVHSRPEEALCDGAQSLTLPGFDDLMTRTGRLLKALAPEETDKCKFKLAI